MPVVFLKGGPGSGNFGHEGRPGQVGGSAPNDGGGASHEDRIAAVRARVSDASGAAAYIEGSPVSLRAAQSTADTLAEMRAKGYAMPDKVFVQRDSLEAPHGSTTYLLLPREGGGMRKGAELHVVFPGALPADANTDDAIASAFGGQTQARGDPLYGAYDNFTVRSTRDIVLHEMAHVQREYAPNFDWGRVEQEFPRWAAHTTPTESAWDRAAKRVSMYASKQPNEFIAEAFVRQYRGEQLPEDSAELYRDLRGPEVK